MTDDLEPILARAWRRESRLHGEAHWLAVVTTGQELVDAGSGADPDVVRWFGWLHDTRRENDAYDPEHGPRAAAFARELHAEGLLPLDKGRLELLCLAIEVHANGQTSADPTVGTCWDADRLHLGRVGIVLRPELLSTEQGRERVNGSD
jgi:uncharacterized protein